ncbi:M1 family metallopeptidase [Candidatus Neomarinimicrobiota bacterium]
MKRLGALLVLLASFISAETIIESHQLDVALEPGNNRLVATDVFHAHFKGSLEFQMHKDFSITAMLVDGKKRDVKTQSNEAGGHHARYTRYRVRLPFIFKGDVEVEVTYSGQRVVDTGETSFSREKIAMEISATISNEGIFLSPHGGFYPLGDETMSQFKTTIRLPAGWDAVSEGRRTARKTESESIIKYQTAHPVEGIHISAAEWEVGEKVVNGVEFYTFFFPEDTTLAKQYLDMSIRYVDMYSEMISPYPFSKFAVVENFFPTGYGMPSYTVLGRTVVRLPFIVYTSLGHEVLHNWWGNSVYIGEGGNWCEGLTTYQADHLYKMQSDENAAIQYRKDILKDYTVYATEGNDFPPAEFTRRSDMSTRTVGYGKVAMIFHMLEEHIGHEPFLEALQLVVERHQWSPATYDDFFQAIEEVSGEDLAAFKDAWVSNAGAPIIGLDQTDEGFSIRQSGHVKPLWIPVRSTLASGGTETSIFYSDQEEVLLPLEPVWDILEIAVDPNFDMMRRLHDEELDVTLRNILSSEELAFIVPSKTEDWQALAQGLHSAIIGDGQATLYIEGEDISGATPIYLGILPEEVGTLLRDGTITIEDKSFNEGAHGMVWAFKGNNGQPALVMYSSTIDELTPLIRKIPHYGKYGYLVFRGGENVLKGNHTTEASPLIWRKN